MTDEEKNIHDLKYEIRQLRERVDELEQTTERLNKTIEVMLVVDSQLLDFISDTAKHVVDLEYKEDKDENDSGKIVNNNGVDHLDT